jgi:predicted metal-dependent hydrolase
MNYDEQFSHGITLFNTKEFFECHDIWEEMWQEERSERRLFLQGMIQAAVACYHLSNGNTTGAISQYQKSLDKLRQYPSDYHGIALDTFRDALAVCLSGAAMMQQNGVSYEVDDSYFPVIVKNES